MKETLRLPDHHAWYILLTRVFYGFPNLIVHVSTTRNLTCNNGSIEKGPSYSIVAVDCTAVVFTDLGCSEFWYGDPCVKSYCWGLIKNLVSLMMETCKDFKYSFSNSVMKDCSFRLEREHIWKFTSYTWYLSTKTFQWLGYSDWLKESIFFVWRFAYWYGCNFLILLM